MSESESELLINNVEEVEIVDNYNYKYTVFYEKIFKNNKTHYLTKTFKTFNAARRFKSRCIINPKVYNVYITATETF